MKRIFTLLKRILRNRRWNNSNWLKENSKGLARHQAMSGSECLKKLIILPNILSKIIGTVIHF